METLFKKLKCSTYTQTWSNYYMHTSSESFLHSPNSFIQATDSRRCPAHAVDEWLPPHLRVQQFPTIPSSKFMCGYDHEESQIFFGLQNQITQVDNWSPTGKINLFV